MNDPVLYCTICIEMGLLGGHHLQQCMDDPVLYWHKCAFLYSNSLLLKGVLTTREVNNYKEYASFVGIGNYRLRVFLSMVL